jgi:YgiT-type zinc finger domain-containing protein
MKCHICGAELKPVITDMPFKTGPRSIVIFKELPVLQCEHCSEYLLQDSVMERVEAMLAKADRQAEVNIFRYAA